MTAMESFLLSYLTNALWQVPLLFAAGWLAARALRPIGPAAEHRVWVSVVLLQALLPVVSMIPWDMIRGLLNFFGEAANSGQPHVSVIMGPGTAFVNPRVPAWVLASLAIAYAAVTAWFAARFIGHLNTIRVLSRNAVSVTLSAEANDYWMECAEAFGIEAPVLGTSAEIYGPITIGINRKLVLLPPEMLAELSGAEFRTVIAHEFAHMRRHDFLKNLLYELLSLPVRFHPVFFVTRERLMESREMVCDEMAAGTANHQEYARSLLRLASLVVDGMPARVPHAIGIFDATTFERRVMRLIEKPAQSSALRRLAVAAACTVLGAGVCATTFALSVHVDALAASDDQHPSKPNGPIAVKPEVMQGQAIHRVPPVYPEEAKKAKIQGTVKLNAVIGKTGAVEQVDVVSGPEKLQQSAVDAVRQWTYKPFLLNGDPVEVKTTVSVVYSLKP